MDVGVLIGRVVFGLLLAGHGAQKLFGWFGGYGLERTGGFLESLGFRPGRVFAAAAGVSEVVGGLLTAFGLFGPIGPALIVSVMIVAAATVHWPHGVFAQNNGIELPLLYGATGAALALTGPGLLSLDALFGLTAFGSASFAWIALAIGVLSGFANLTLRRIPATAGAAS